MKTKSPILLTMLLCVVAVLADCLIIWALSASSSSFNNKWLTLCGLLVIFATLGGYHLFDGRRPVSSSHRLLYSVICGAFSAGAGWAAFTITARAWNTDSIALVKNGGVSLSQSAWGQTGFGAFVGFLICYYGFRHVNET